MRARKGTTLRKITMKKDDPIRSQLSLEVLQQFRVIYGSMRQHFRDVENRCKLPGSQMWVLQEVHREPDLGITDLAVRLGIHQSTCSLLVEKLVEGGYLFKARRESDRRRIGLRLGAPALEALSRLPGPAEGILPAALAELPAAALKKMHASLQELIENLAHKNDSFASKPLAEIVRDAGDGRTE